MTASPFRTALTAVVANPSHPDLTVRQLLATVILRDEPRRHCTIKWMAAEMKVGRPVITRAADRLTEMGYVVRQPDENDRRNVFLLLTKSGREFAASLPATVSP